MSPKPHNRRTVFAVLAICLVIGATVTGVLFAVQSAREKAEIQARVDAVVALIDEIGTPTYTSGETIERAEQALGSLPPEEQALVPNREDLVLARTRFDALIASHPSQSIDLTDLIGVWEGSNYFIWIENTPAAQVVVVQMRSKIIGIGYAYNGVDRLSSASWTGFDVKNLARRGRIHVACGLDRGVTVFYASKDELGTVTLLLWGDAFHRVEACARCGEYHAPEKMTDYLGKLLCPDCYKTLYDSIFS